MLVISISPKKKEKKISFDWRNIVSHTLRRGILVLTHTLLDTDSMPSRCLTFEITGTHLAEGKAA